ncbi:phage tail sheath family protein [Chitinophaga barathri]|uniref:Phage tail protein n=1 Tax=Chitinophaga barathri TaxID=1647451 RepID=A0A3N4M6C4_9BACT|nr:phage tail sheath C-terminal domain-containing protein [Chitinophaga barathri]RPD38904.1 phage tail protein [Chitinophaga barathri]
MDYKTPGVFVEELQLIPPSVASVATAIPAFIGHTAVTADAKGATLVNVPIRITSILEYTTVFGGGYSPASYSIRTDAQFNITRITPVNGRRYHLFDAMQHYFDNGGGPCYIVTVGNYTADIILGTATTGLLGGLKALEKVDEPTLLVSPDSVSLHLPDGTPDYVNGGNFHQAVIEQCARLQDRFGILDLLGGGLALNHADNPVLKFRTGVGNQELKYAAGYYPWLQTSYLKDISFSQLNIVDNADAAVPDATIDTMTGNPVLDALVTDLRARILEENRVFGKIAAPVLNRGNFNPMSAHLTGLRADVVNAGNAAQARTNFNALITFVRSLALSLRDLEDDAGNSPAMIHVIAGLKANTALRTQIINLISFEKNQHVRSSVAAARTEINVDGDYVLLDTQDWVAGAAISTIGPNGTNFDGGSVQATAINAANATMLQTAFEAISGAYVAILQDAIFRTDQAQQQLFLKHPFFKAVYERVRVEMSLLPPSGAVAGIYAATDRSRGVWKAPANVSLRSVVTPAYKLTDQEQSTLNVHETGKSINAIRAFTGKGILVWGARTLAGNDNEWRYINVRRFFNYVEESTKKASEPFVFEGNDANTWVRIRAMIENFLTLQWRQGALAGATTKQAFYVKVGLNETMTAQDILEGRLIVEIGMAAVRPAEFIILRFSHKMQES